MRITRMAGIGIVLLMAILGACLAYYWYELKPTAVVLLETTITPPLAIRGRCAALDYKISRLPFALLKDDHPDAIKTGWEHNDLYVVLEKQGAYWQAVSAYKKWPRGKTRIVLWGKCNSKTPDAFIVRYNIESLVLAPETAGAFKTFMQQVTASATPEKVIVDVLIRINRQGKARIKQLLWRKEPVG